MNVLLLSPYAERLFRALQDHGDTYIVEDGPITANLCRSSSIDFIVSYGYRHIIREDVLKLFPQKVINLHVSMLPECRGSHPNFWSILEGSSSGFTIHYIDVGLDTGNILFQHEVQIDVSLDTFRTSYNRLCAGIEWSFHLNWKYLRTSECPGWKQQGEATCHRSFELEEWVQFLPNSWDTPIRDFFELSGQRMSQNS